MCRVLARLYVLEVDEKMLTQMKQMVLPTECTEVDLADGYRLLRQYLDTVADSDEGGAKQSIADSGEEDAKQSIADPGAEDGKQSMADAVTDLEVEYARIFLAAGISSGKAAFPYESVYTSRKHLVNQESNDDMTALYAAKGLKAREDMYRIPDDHAGLEFEYMARLIDEAASAAGAEDEARLDEDMEEQKAFFKAHLMRWIPIFGEDIRSFAQTDFFRGVGRITRGFMAEETELFK